MTGIASFIRKLPDFNGDARLYHVHPPMPYGWDQYDDFGNEITPKPTTDYVIVSALDRAFDTGSAETYIFPSNRDGEVTDWRELEGSFRGDTDHTRALKGAGYEVVKVDA